MKSLRKIISLLGLALLIFCIAATVYASATVPKLSEEQKVAIREVMRSPVPDMVLGKTGFARSKVFQVWYEAIPPKGDMVGTVVFVMGATKDALSWPTDFIARFTKAGYRVVRYDHHDTRLTVSEKN